MLTKKESTIAALKFFFQYIAEIEVVTQPLFCQAMKLQYINTIEHVPQSHFLITMQTFLQLQLMS